MSIPVRWLARFISTASGVIQFCVPELQLPTGSSATSSHYANFLTGRS